MDKSGCGNCDISCDKTQWNASPVSYPYANRWVRWGNHLKGWPAELEGRNLRRQNSGLVIWNISPITGQLTHLVMQPQASAWTTKRASKNQSLEAVQNEHTGPLRLKLPELLGRMTVHKFHMGAVRQPGFVAARLEAKKNMDAHRSVPTVGLGAEECWGSTPKLELLFFFSTLAVCVSCMAYNKRV